MSFSLLKNRLKYNKNVHIFWFIYINLHKHWPQWPNYGQNRVCTSNKFTQALTKMAKLWAKLCMHIKYWAYLLDYLAYNMAKYQYFSNDSNNEQKLSLVCIVHDISSFPQSEKTILGSKILKLSFLHTWGCKNRYFQNSIVIKICVDQLIDNCFLMFHTKFHQDWTKNDPVMIKKPYAHIWVRVTFLA